MHPCGRLNQDPPKCQLPGPVRARLESDFAGVFQVLRLPVGPEPRPGCWRGKSRGRLEQREAGGGQGGEEAGEGEAEAAARSKGKEAGRGDEAQPTP